MTQVTVPGSGSGRSPFLELGLLRGLGGGMREEGDDVNKKDVQEQRLETIAKRDTVLLKEANDALRKRPASIQNAARADRRAMHRCECKA